MKETTWTSWTLLAENCRDEKLQKSCRNCKPWDVTVVILASSVSNGAWRNCTFNVRKSLQKMWREIVIFIQCSDCIILGCVAIKANVSLGKTAKIFERNESKYRYLSKKIGLISSRRATSSISDILSNKTEIINCNREKIVLPLLSFQTRVLEKN